MNRRDFVQASVLASGGLVLGFSVDGSGEDIGVGSDRSVELGDFLRIAPDGSVLFRVTKHEMGQGVATSLAQILCEELEADWSRVQVQFGIVDLARYENDERGRYGTGGSASILQMQDLLRRAGATARDMLIAAAAETWGIPQSRCQARDHYVHDVKGLRRLGFGELAVVAARMSVPGNVQLKKDSSFHTIGTGKPSKLAPQIVTGQLQYGLDIQLPGMLYALVERCPVFKGKVKRYDATAALAIPGVRKVFATTPIAGLQAVRHLPHDIRDGIAVVADNFWAARKGRDALKIEWDEGPNARFSTEDFEGWAADRARRRTDPIGFIGDANAISNVTHVSQTLRASYVYPHQMHSCMEVMNCTAHARPDGCELWTGTQDPVLVIAEVSKLLKLPQSTIKLHFLTSGGGFGRRAYTDAAVEAAFISREAGHVPVKMMWTREDDQRCNLAHMFQHMEYQAALDRDQRLYAWYEKEIRTYTWAQKYANPELPLMAYDVPNIRFDFEDMIDQELVQSSAWRGVLIHGRAYSECFIDEIAAHLKQDPYRFRLSLLKEGRDVHLGGGYRISSDRLRAVLTTAAREGGWGKSLPAGHGMGIAVMPYAGSCCAALAHVAVENKKLVIQRITVAADCGRVINPSSLNQQMVGGIVWGLTAVLYGGAPIKDGRLVHGNFHENKLLRMNECPPIDVHLVNDRAERPFNAGEISSPIAVPAVLNAIYAATGKRIRRVPIESDALA